MREASEKDRWWYRVLRRAGVLLLLLLLVLVLATWVAPALAAGPAVDGVSMHPFALLTRGPKLLDLRY